MKIGTVCSGIGSPEVAIRKHNHSIAFACEIDKYARASYTAIHGEVTMFTDMTSDDFHLNAGYCDLFIGGIPCQAFSLAGKRLGELDKRGLLFYDFYKYVQNNQPKVFIIENVKGLLSDAGGKTFQNWLLLLGNSVNGHTQMFGHPDSLGYNLHHTVLNSKDFGVPQNRERVFLVGIRSDLTNDFRFPKGWKLDKRLKDVLEVAVDEKYYLSEKTVSNLTVYNERQIKNGTGFSAKFRDVETTEIMDTIKIGGGGKDDLIQVKEATKQGFAVAEAGDSINLSNPNSKTRRGRVGKGIANTLDTACNQAVVEPKLIQVVQMDGFESEGRIYDSDGLSRTIKAGGGGGSKTGWYLTSNQEKKYNSIKVNSEISGCLTEAIGRGGSSSEYLSMLKRNEDLTGRIRRLTPLECWRLQGFSDEDFYTITECNNVVSKQGIFMYISRELNNELICKNVKLKTAIEKLKAKDIVLCTTKGIENMEMQTIFSHIPIENTQNAKYKIAIDKLTVEGFAYHITTQTENTTTLYIKKCQKKKLQKKTLKKGEDLEQEALKLTGMFIRITLDMNLKKENAFIISTVIPIIMNSITSICLGHKENTINAIISYSNLHQNLLEKELLALKTDNILSISDSSLYKQAGNSITTNVMEAIIDNLIHLL